MPYGSDPSLTTTAFELPGYRITKSFGVVRGIMVRSRSIVGNFGARSSPSSARQTFHLHEPLERARGHVQPHASPMPASRATPSSA